jgi:hypothetical protein
MAKSPRSEWDPAQRDKQSAATKARWDDPVSEARLREAIANPENRAKVSAAMKARWDEPAARNKMTASIKASLARPEVRAKLVAAASSLGRSGLAGKDDRHDEESAAVMSP